MQFQSFLDPFGAALRQESQRLQNDGQSLANATNLYKLGMAREQYDAMIRYNMEERLGAESVGGVLPLDPTKNGQGSKSLAEAGTGASSTPTAPNSQQLFQLYSGFDKEA